MNELKKKKRKRRLLSGLVICLLIVGIFMLNPKKPSFAADDNLLTTYGKGLGHMGNCVTLSQLQNQNTLRQIKAEYNSITLENEMKPDYLLGSSANLISVSEAKNLGYYIPSGYNEAYVPRINFNTVDAVLKICYQNGLGVRAHTLVWHSQTPSWFFRSGYNGYNGFVNQSSMNSRMEFYIKTVMNHVYSSQYGSCVYAWDVVNEYLHASNSGWLNIYGGVNTRPQFLKTAFQYAYDCLDYYGLVGKVSLFYNDYNTYMEANDILTMVNYINSDKKICNGVGMQSHLDTSYPSASQFKSTVQQFVNAGLEVQITEFDVTNSNGNTQANYCYDIMQGVMDIKKAGGKVTGFTVWGLYDSISWRASQSPTLFSNLTSPKSSYYKVIQAYKDSGYTPTTDGGEVLPTVLQTTAPATQQPASGKMKDGWYYIKNLNAQKYLQVANNQGGNSVNVELGIGVGAEGQKWYLTNLDNGYVSLKNGQGYMLDVVYGENEDGTNIQTYTAHGQDPQVFKLAPTSTNNGYGILTKCSSESKALDAYNWGTTDGTNVCQWSYFGAENQIWIFESCNPTTEAPTVAPTTKPTVAPTEAPMNETKTWKFSDSAFANINNLTSTIVADDLTLYATENKPMNVKTDSKTYNGTTYTKYLALGGSGNTSYRSVAFDVTENTRITVIAKSSGTSTRYLSIRDAQNKQLYEIECGTSLNSDSYTYTGETGKLYLCSNNSGINLYEIKVERKTVEIVSPTQSAAPTATPKVTVAPTATPAATKKPTTTTYEKMVANSLISTGNNYRVKKAIEKAQKGEDVTIAYIGGSITEGAMASPNNQCYAYQSYLMFKEKFGKNGGNNVHFVNAGLSGTPSSLGMIRYEHDVVKKAASQPDIVFVEFAVNDADDVTNGDAYESLVRNILKESNDPAVILLFSVFQSQWNLQDRFIPVGKHYNLPMISIKDAVVPEINSGRLTNAQFFANDGWHPTNYGHKIMADCIMNAFEEINCQTKANSDITIPSTAQIGKSYDGIKMIDSASNISGVSINIGGFSTKDTATGTYLFDNSLKFSDTWMHTGNNSGTSFTMNLTCKNLLLVYKLSNSNNTGSADVYIDGRLVKTVNGYSSGGWNNPQTIVLMNNSSSSSHKVEIKMANGNASKEFTILGFGFTK